MPGIQEVHAGARRQLQRHRTGIPEILQGKYPENTTLQNAPFDEKLSIIGLLIDSLNQQFHRYAVDLGVQKQLYAQLGIVRDLLKSREDAQVSGLLTGQKKQLEEDLKRSMAAKLLSRQEEAVRRKVLGALSELIQKLTLQGTGDTAQDYELVRAWFKAREDRRSQEIGRTGDALTNSFGFLSGTFGEGQELVIFLSELTAGYYSLKFVSECGNDAYYQYNSLLLLKDRRQELTQEVRKFTAGDTELEI